MANQHTKAAADAAALAGTEPAPDAPDLSPEPTEAEPVLQLTQAELEDMLADAAERAAERATRAAAQRGAVVNTVTAAALDPVVTATAEPPTTPTYEPGEVDDDGVAYAATIVAVSPRGREVEVTPKVFRTILAAKGYVAHPADAVQHLGNEPRRTRRSQRSGNIDGTTTEELASAPRRRRRAAPAAE